MVKVTLKFGLGNVKRTTLAIRGAYNSFSVSVIDMYLWTRISCLSVFKPISTNLVSKFFAKDDPMWPLLDVKSVQHCLKMYRCNRLAISCGGCSLTSWREEIDEFEMNLMIRTIKMFTLIPTFNIQWYHHTGSSIACTLSLKVLVYLVSIQQKEYFTLMWFNHILNFGCSFPCATQTLLLNTLD